MILALPEVDAPDGLPLSGGGMMIVPLGFPRPNGLNLDMA